MMRWWGCVAINIDVDQSIDTNQALAWSSPHKWSRLSVWMQVPAQPDWLHTPGTGRPLPQSDPPPATQHDGMSVVLIRFCTVSKIFLSVSKNKTAKGKICEPYKLYQRQEGCELPSTWWFRCVSCPHNTPWYLNLQREEAFSRSRALSGHHSSAMRCHTEQREELK